MIRIMVMNGLLISLILIWTSSAKEPSAGNLVKSSTKPSTGPLNYSVSKPMVSLHETNKEILSRKFVCGSEFGGVCVNKKKSCPSNLPSEKSPGKPYCSNKKHRCCYPDPTTAAPPTVVPTTTTTSEDVNWSDIRNACIKSNNYKTYQPLALDICKEKCVEEDAINCQSIEYSSAQQMCAISEARSDSDDFIEPCFVDGWVFAERELNAGPTTGAPTTTAPGNTTTNVPTTGAPTTTASSNTTANVSSCNLVWNYEEDRPLIMIRETKTIVPPIIDIEISEDPNRIPEGKKLIFACPGENNQFNQVQGTHTKLHGECISHEQFKVCVNNYPEILDLSQLSCSSKMQPSIIKQDNDTTYEKSCEDIGGELYKFGYIYGDYREFKDLDTKFCFREKDQTTLWTSTNIDRIEISPSMRSMDPANFRTARGLAMNTFYSQKSQQETLKEILDKEVTSVWNDKACRNHGGHCVRGGRPCPKHLPHHTSQGEPFCTSFYRCCYSDQCDPSTCTYKGKKGNCSLDYLPGTTGVGSQECKKGCQCYIKDNKTLLQFKSFQERKELSKLLRGNMCQAGVRDCNPECQNGGTCNFNLQCVCAPGWKGKSCQFKDCNPECQNGGTCNSNLKCVCAPGWKGKSCQLKDCNPKCQNGGKCIYPDLQCDCVPGWTGESCDIEECKLTWTYGSPQFPPLILDSKEQIVLPKGEKLNFFITIEEGKVLIVCSQTELENVNGNPKTIEGTCKNGKLSINGDQIEDLNDMGCLKAIQSSIIEKKSSTSKPDQDRCGAIDAGLTWLIGFETYQTSNPFHTEIEVCFQTDEETTLFTYSKLHGKSLSAKDIKYKKSFDSSAQFTISMDKIYTEKNEIALFKEVQGVTINFNAQTFFSKGHLTPRSDFITNAGQETSYYYLNALPQWQKYNERNWALLEQIIENLAKKNKALLDIYTGGSGYMKTPEGVDIFLGQSLDTKEKKVPIPNLYWKVVTFSKDGIIAKAVAFVINNNPLKEDPKDFKAPCKDVCGDLWMKNGEVKLLRKPERGYTYCCNVNELKEKDFPNIPKISSNVLLLKNLK